MILAGNVADNWRRKFEWNFLNDSIASRLSWEPDAAYQTLIFLTVEEEPYEIYNWLDNEEDKMRLDIVIKKIEEFFVCETRSLRILLIPPPEVRCIRKHRVLYSCFAITYKKLQFKIDLYGTKRLIELEIILLGKSCCQKNNKYLQKDRARLNNRQKLFLLMLMQVTLMTTGLQRKGTTEIISINLNRN